MVMTDEAVQANGERRIVNLVEAAFVLGVSDKTLQSEIRLDPNFPVIERGKNGVAYQLDLDAVIEYRTAKKAAESEAEAERRHQLQLWAEEYYGAGPEESKHLTPAERRVLALAVKDEDYNRWKRGELVEAKPYEQRLTSAIVTLRQSLLDIPVEFAKRTGVDREIRVELEKMIEVRLNELARALGDAKAHRGDIVERAA